MTDIHFHYHEDGRGRPKHGSPEDRGSADRYYGRRYNPHWNCPVHDKRGTLLRWETITSEGMSASEIAAYNVGFYKETDRKDWGDGPVSDYDSTLIEEC